MSKEKRGARAGKRLLIVLIVLAVLLGGLGIAGAYLWGEYGERISRTMGWVSNDYEGDGSGEVVVVITEGEIGEDIAASLDEADVVKTSEAFYELLLAQDPAVEFMPGSYELRLQMSAQSALDALQNPDNRMDLTAMIPEGSTVDQTLEIVSAGSGIPLEELQQAAEDPSAYDLPKNAESLEGWLFPATYEFETDTTAEQAIAMMVEYQKRNLDEFGVAKKDRERVLTIASMVQREGGTIEDFGKISRVIFNRLDAGMKLEMDSTVQYGAQEHDDGSVWSTDEALADDNLWNTYMHKGLPVGPIANPGRDAIEAAINPEKGDWVYFVVTPDGGGSSTFSSDIETHDQAVAELRAWCDADSSRGC
ncbi:endolytic transglycosylase MltG [Leucobacter sp. GX24907]